MGAKDQKKIGVYESNEKQYIFILSAKNLTIYIYDHFVVLEDEGEKYFIIGLILNKISSGNIADFLLKYIAL